MSVWFKLITNSVRLERSAKNTSSSHIELEAVSLIESEIKNLDATIDSFKDDADTYEKEKNNFIKEQGLCRERIEQLQALIEKHQNAKEESLVEMLEDERKSQQQIEVSIAKKIKLVARRLGSTEKEKVICILHRRRLHQQVDTLNAFQKMQSAKLKMNAKNGKNRIVTAFDILKK